MEISSQIFEIFRLRPDGSELYVCKAASYNIAVFDVEMLASKVPAKYVIRDRRNDQRHFTEPGAPCGMNVVADPALALLKQTK